MKGWLGVYEVEIRRDLILLQHHDGFEGACHSARRLQMTNITLNTSLMRCTNQLLIGAD
jgi:hypothetical protein